MMRLTKLMVAIAVSLGSFALIGCESPNQSDLPRDQGMNSGGNGAFGENPTKPGDYSN